MESKSTTIAYITWVFFLHYAYLGRWGTFIIFILTGGGFFIWWFIDLFRIPGLVRVKNLEINQMRGVGNSASVVANVGNQSLSNQINITNGGESNLDKLEKLSRLRDSGAISEEEFQERRLKYLD